jgi:hypothetical protein
MQRKKKTRSSFGEAQEGKGQIIRGEAGEEERRDKVEKAGQI